MSLDYYESLWEAVPEGLEPAFWKLRRGFLLENVSVGERVLDVGCGEGRFMEALAEAGAEPVGLDVAEEPLRRVGRRRPGLDVRLVADGPWPVEDSGFDVVWAGEVIEHVADTAGWLSEVRRALRPGGRLLISTPAHGRLALLRMALAPGAFESHFNPRSDHLRFYTRRALTELLGDFRFDGVHIAAAGGPPGARRVLLARAVRARF